MLDGNGDPAGMFVLSINRFDSTTGIQDAMYILSVDCDKECDWYNAISNYGFKGDPDLDENPPYIDHLHIHDTWMFGTTGHTTNHNKQNGEMKQIGKVPMVFKIELDNNGHLKNGAFIVRELKVSEFDDESYITGVKGKMDGDHVHILFQRFKTNEEGVFYIKVRPFE